MLLVSVFDDCLAPVFWTLDNQPAYFDPMLAPDDFVQWLASWVALTPDENWSLARQRALIARATQLYRWRGTARGLADQVEIFIGVRPEIVDSGGVSWSATPGTSPPGDPVPTVTIRLRVPDPASIDMARLNDIVSRSKPAHVGHSIEVVAS